MSNKIRRSVRCARKALSIYDKTDLSLPAARVEKLYDKCKFL